MSGSALELFLLLYALAGCLLLVGYWERHPGGKALTYFFWPAHVMLYYLLRPFVKAAAEVTGTPGFRRAADCRPGLQAGFPRSGG